MDNEDNDKEPSFAELMSGVRKLEDDRVNHYPDRRSKSHKPNQKSSSVESPPDFSSLNFQQESELDQAYFDSGIQRKLQRRIRQGQIPIEDRVDLHGFTQKQAIAELQLFLQDALDAEYKLVLIIHGKGSRSERHAVLRSLLRHWLAQQPGVLAWCPAQARHGGEGASYVYLRSNA